MTPIRVAVTGTHSTGKTTLLQRMEMELRGHGVNVARTGGNMATKAAALGFPKLHRQTADTTTWIIAAGVCSELETALTADVVLVDRAALDPSPTGSPPVNCAVTRRTRPRPNVFGTLSACTATPTRC